MPVREHEQYDRQGSESSGNTSWVSQETVRDKEESRRNPAKPSADGRDAEPFPGTLMAR